MKLLKQKSVIVRACAFGDFNLSANGLIILTASERILSLASDDKEALHPVDLLTPLLCAYLCGLFCFACLSFCFGLKKGSAIDTAFFPLILRTN